MAKRSKSNDDLTKAAARRRAKKGKEATPDKGKDKPKKGLIREWTETLIFALVFVVTVHTFIFQPFIVPTPSMAGTVMAGDYLVVSKLHYGAKTSATIGVPYTDLYIDGIEIPSTRFPGFSEVKRGDVVVFHLPVDEKPLDKRQPYLKRTVALPGDRFELRDKQVVINGEPWSPNGGVLQQDWLLTQKEGVVLPGGKLRELGIEDIAATGRPNEFRIKDASVEVVGAVRELPYVEQIVPMTLPANAAQADIFPPDAPYNRDQFGPLVVPAEGLTVPLNDSTWTIYGEAINQYEERNARRLAMNQFEIDGQEATEYTFTQDYYFMMGDNRDNSLDSRFWGFVPMDHVMGKAVMTLFSWDGGPRLDRFLKPIR